MTLASDDRLIAYNDNEKLAREVRFLIDSQGLADDLAAALRKMVEVYREGQKDPRDEPQCIWQSIQVLNKYDAARVSEQDLRLTSNEYLHSVIRSER